MFYELSREYPLQTIRYVSVTGDGYTGTVKQFYSVKGITLPSKNAIRLFPNVNRQINDIVVLSSFLYLDVKELKRKNIIPKLEDFVIITLPSLGRKKHFIATIEGTIEDIIILGLKTPISLDNNDSVIGCFKTFINFSDQYTIVS